jgi:hypothetical protein
MTHTGHVRKNPNPNVKIATTSETTNITMAPGIVEYSIPIGPKRIVRIAAIPTLFRVRATTTGVRSGGVAAVC